MLSLPATGFYKFGSSGIETENHHLVKLPGISISVRGRKPPSVHFLGRDRRRKRQYSYDLDSLSRRDTIPPYFSDKMAYADWPQVDRALMM
jgi:hypothetical protein